MPELSSRAIAAAEYDAASQILKLYFHGSGGPYEYPGVPVSIYEGLLSAASAGSYYNAFIKHQYGSAGRNIAITPRRARSMF